MSGLDEHLAAARTRRSEIRRRGCDPHGSHRRARRRRSTDRVGDAARPPSPSRVSGPPPSVPTSVRWRSSEQRDRRQPRAHSARPATVRLADADRGARTRRVEVHGWTLGARTRQLASAIAAAAETCGADVIVLGMDRRRMARRHLTPSLRDQLTSATALPVLVAPSTAAAAAPSGGDRRHDPGGRARRALRDV